MQTKKLVLILDPFNTYTPSRGGATATIYYHCSREAQRDGFAPVVLARPFNAPSYAVPQVLGVAPPRPAIPGWPLLSRVERKLLGYQHIGHRGYIRRLVKLLRAEGLENSPIITSESPEAAVCLAEAYPAARVIHWFHTSHLCKPRFRKSLRESSVRCVAVSAFTARWAERAYGLPIGSVQAVFNAVDLEAFRPGDTPAPLPLVINYHGRISPDKGPDLLLKASLILARRGRRFALQFVGSNHSDGLVVDEYQKGLMAREGELANYGVVVRRYGLIAQPDVPHLLRKAHIHVCTSRCDEAFGMATLEGMACGLATVASDTGGTPEVVGDAGFLFERGSVEQLAGHLERLILDEGLRREYAAKARQRAEQFTWAKTWAGIRDVITG